jgi:hypothetical protein
MSTFEWADHRRRRTALFTEIDRDIIQVAGETFLTSTRTVLDERDRDEYLNVSAGLAVLAGIAASDSICCSRAPLAAQG